MAHESAGAINPRVTEPHQRRLLCHTELLPGAGVERRPHDALPHRKARAARAIGLHRAHACGCGQHRGRAVSLLNAAGGMRWLRRYLTSPSFPATKGRVWGGPYSPPALAISEGLTGLCGKAAGSVWQAAGICVRLADLTHTPPTRRTAVRRRRHHWRSFATPTPLVSYLNFIRTSTSPAAGVGTGRSAISSTDEGSRGFSTGTRTAVFFILLISCAQAWGLQLREEMAVNCAQHLTSPPAPSRASGAPCCDRFFDQSMRCIAASKTACTLM